MSRRLRRIKNKWESADSGDQYDLKKITDWVDSLEKELKRSKGDTQFIIDLLEASRKYFIKNFTEEEKADCFVYLVGLFHRKIN
tara:strand:- start:2142 stop:2393 length:252 start_codon:yes stop_codon:yes gene_type:complete